MASVFISYRRSDAPEHAGRIRDAFAARFGAANVFKDLDSVEPGAHYVEALEDAIKRSDAMIVVIGNEWSAGDRMRDARDWVRIEIARAFEREIRVIPVLVEGAVMPSPADLPRDVTTLGLRQAVALAESTWDAQLTALVDFVQTAIEQSEPATAKDVPVLSISRACAAYDDAVDSYEADAISEAAWHLGMTYEEYGLLTEAREAYQTCVDSGGSFGDMMGVMALDRLDRA
jgi:TIR domain-containing protein